MQDGSGTLLVQAEGQQQERNEETEEDMTNERLTNRALEALRINIQRNLVNPHGREEALKTLTAYKDQTERLIGALHGLLFLQFRHWPLSEEDKAIPFVQGSIVPILPLVEAFHEKLHGGPTPQLRQTTQAERDLIERAQGLADQQRGLLDGS